MSDEGNAQSGMLCLMRNIHNHAAERAEGNADDAVDADTAAGCMVTYYLHGYNTIYGYD